MKRQKHRMKLKITSFRGSTCTFPLAFDQDKPVCVLFGENGTGKSTIADAFDVVCNGRLGSLGETSGATYGHAVSITSKPADLKIELEIDSSNYIGKVKSSRIERSQPGNCPTAHILRRNQLLKLLTTQPAKRYEELKNFIDVSLIENAETGIREALKQLEQIGIEAKTAINTNENILKSLQLGHTDTDAPWLKWAVTQSAIETEALDVSLKTLQIYKGKYDGLSTTYYDLQSASQELNNAIELKKKAIDDFLEKSTHSSSGVASVVKLLKETQKYLNENTNVTQCPVCEQKISQGQLAGRIQVRLTEFEPLVKAGEEVDKADLEVTLKRTAFSQKLATLFDAIIGFDSQYQTATDPDILNVGFDWTKHAKLESVSDYGSQNLSSLVDVAQSRIDAFSLCRKKKAEEETKKQSESSLLSGVKKSYKSYTDSVAKLKKTESQIQWAGNLLGMIENQRKAFSDNLLLKISSDVQSLYSQIHPNESIGGLSISLDPEKKGSVNVQADFHGKTGVPPQAYYSESHLDTLGLCVFIAIALERANPEDLLILDDVLTSCDEQHIDRIITMLEGLSDKFNKVIITTHYRPWRDRYRLQYAKTSQVQLEELQEWTLPVGIRHASTKLSADELTEVIKKEPIDRQAICSKAGILLEAILDRLSLIYQCRLPHRSEKEFTISEYLGGFDRKLKSVLAVEKILPADTTPSMIKLESIFEYLNGETWIRNKVGCHFHLEEGVSNPKVKEFGEKIIELAGIVTCLSCGSLPYRDKDGSTWMCKCGALKLHPHAQPN